MSCCSTAFASTARPASTRRRSKPADAADTQRRRRRAPTAVGRRGQRFQAGRVPSVERSTTTRTPPTPARRRQPRAFVRRQLLLQTLRSASAAPSTSSWIRSTAAGSSRGQHRQHAHAAGNGVAIGAQRAQGTRRRRRTSDAMPPRSRSAPSTAISADRAGAVDVRAAARRQIEAGDLDQPERALRARVPSAAAALAASAVDTKRIETGRSSQTMRLASSTARSIVRRRRLARKVDRRDLRAHVEAHGPVVEEPIERRRQHVLPGVLLHVIEAARPVDLAGDASRLRASGADSTWIDVVSVIDGLDDVDVRRAGRCRRAGRRTWDRRRCDRA